MNQEPGALIIVVGWALLLIVLTHVRRNVRSLRLKALAKKYNLVYTKNFKIFYLFYPNNVKFNVVSGNIKGHQINIYDLVGYYFWTQVGSGIISYSTTVEIDDTTKLQTKKSFLSLHKISAELDKLT